MTGTLAPTPPRSRWPLERRWDAARPLPVGAIVGKAAPTAATPFDFTAAMRVLCEDIILRVPTFAPLDLSRMLVSFTPCRTRSRFGLMARVTPMRYKQGALTRRMRGVLYGTQRYYVDGREMLYVVTFCLPRFLDQTFEEKLTTVFHELFHVSPAFDGDIRRLPGRCEVHSRSKQQYDENMLKLVRVYLADHPRPEVYEPFRFRTTDLLNRHGRIVGTVVPRPMLIPLAW
jgi:predicted metallopeptidase